MKRKISTLFLAFIASTCMLFAQSGTWGDHISWNISDSVLTISGDSAMNWISNTDVPWREHYSSIAAVVINEGITSIGDFAFYSCANLTSITIPNSVESIGYSAFESCTSIISIEIPNNVTTLRNHAFYNCTGLTSITIPNSVTSIGDNAFQYCSNLSSVNIPNSVTSIGAYTFYNSGLTSPIYTNKIFVYLPIDYSGVYSIPEGIEVIAGGAFASCEGLNSIIIPYGVTSIGTEAFNNCTSLTSVSIPNSVTIISKNAFSLCTNLTSIEIPNSVTYIGAYAFYACSLLKSVTIGNNVAKIGIWPFSGCLSLTSVVWNAKNCSNFDTNLKKYPFYDIRTIITDFTFGDSVEYIPPYLCYEMTNLSSLTIGQNVTSIDATSFSGCSNIDSIVWRAKNCSSDIPIFASSSDHVSYFAFGDSVEYIPTYLCSGMTAIDSISIPNSVRNIGMSAFHGCSNLSYVTIGDSVTSIGNNAFASCNSLPIADNLRYADTYLVEAVDKTLPTYTIKEGTKFIGNGAFSGCSNLTAIYVPCGELEYFQQLLSKNASKVKYTPLPYNLATYAENGYVSVLNDLTLCDDEHIQHITAIPNYGYHFTQWNDGVTDNPRTFVITQDTSFTAEFAFDRTGTCGNEFVLNWVYDPNAKVLTISGNGAFEQNMECGAEARTNLEEIVFDEGVTSIGQSAFANCATLTMVTFGKDIKKIYESAFYNCENLTAIYSYRPTPPNIYSTTFDGVDKFGCVLYVPETSVELYQNAAVWRDFYNILPIPVPCQPDLFNEDTILCEGSILHEMPSFTWHGHTISHPIHTDTIYDIHAWPSLYRPISDWYTYYDSLITRDGCDSVFQLDVQWIPSYSVIIYDTINEGEYHWVLQRVETNPGTYVQTLNYMTMLGCDSIERWIVTVNPLPQYTITLSANNSKYGSVEGAGTFKQDSTITVTAIPNKGYQFNEWSDGNTDNPRQITVTQDSTFTAIFGNKMCSWLVESNDLEMGAVVTSFNNEYYQYGTQITVEASPNSGYKFVKWNDGKKFNPYKFSILDDKYLLAIFMEEEGEQDTTTVQPSSTSATFTWPFIVGGFSYSLTIYLDVACTIPFCTITFNQYGQLIGISFGNRAPRRSMEQEDGFTYTVSGLDANTEYYFKMETMDEDNKLINTDEGAFRTTNDATGIENQYNTVIEHRKVMINGQIYILRGDKTYTLQGQEME